MAGKKSKGQVRFIDLFAGCGGLSEDFIQVCYTPVAHVEVDVGVGCIDLRGGYHGRA